MQITLRVNPGLLGRLRRAAAMRRFQKEARAALEDGRKVPVEEVQAFICAATGRAAREGELFLDYLARVIGADRGRVERYFGLVALGTEFTEAWEQAALECPAAGSRPRR